MWNGAKFRERKRESDWRGGGGGENESSSPNGSANKKKRKSVIKLGKKKLGNVPFHRQVNGLLHTELNDRYEQQKLGKTR